MPTTTETLALIRALARVEFRQLDRQDRAAFADAPATALIGFSGDDAAPFAEACSCPVSIEGKDAIAIIISDDTIEMHGCTADGDAFAMRLTLDVDAL